MSHHANLKLLGLTHSDIDDIEAIISPMSLDEVVLWWDDSSGCWTVLEKAGGEARLAQCDPTTGWEAV